MQSNGHTIVVYEWHLLRQQPTTTNWQPIRNLDSETLAEHLPNLRRWGVRLPTTQQAQQLSQRLGEPVWAMAPGALSPVSVVGKLRRA